LKILSIDGGGVRGVVPAVVLAHWESEDSVDLSSRFDLFAGTSTGAILAGSLAAGLKASDLVELFRAEIREIFARPEGSFVGKVLSFKGWAVPAYSSEHLRSVLTRHLGGVTLGSLSRPLVLASLDVVTGSPKVFRSGSGPDRDVSLVDAILASAAAPVVFPSVQAGASTYVDGALWANNPSLIALLDSGVEGSSLLSLGCGRPLWGGRVGFGSNRGIVGWGLPIVTLLLGAQSEGVHEYVSRLLPPERYLRVNPVLPKHLAAIDKADNLPDLVARSSEAAREVVGSLRGRF
jgi:hypothetical protein